MMRYATFNDLDRIDEMAVYTIHDMALSNIPQWTITYPRKEHYQQDIENNQLFVCEIDNVIRGAIVICPEQDPPYETIDGWYTNHGDSLVIHRAIVDPFYRNHGVAQEMLDYAIHLAHQQGYQSIKIDTHRDNYKMRQFLEKNQFVYIGYLAIINREAYERLLEDHDEDIINRMEK